MKSLALVFLGGGAGAVARYGIGMVTVRLMGPGFPWGTVFVNILGSFLMGLLVAGLLHLGTNARGDGAGPLGAAALVPDVRLALATGFLGGFTTFSAFSLDAVTLMERGSLLLAAAYVVASVLLSITALFAGMAFVRWGVA